MITPECLGQGFRNFKLKGKEIEAENLVPQSPQIATNQMKAKDGNVIATLSR